MLLHHTDDYNTQKEKIREKKTQTIKGEHILDRLLKYYNAFYWKRKWKPKQNSLCGVSKPGPYLDGDNSIGGLSWKMKTVKELKCFQMKLNYADDLINSSVMTRKLEKKHAEIKNEGSQGSSEFFSGLVA